MAVKSFFDSGPMLPDTTEVNLPNTPAAMLQLSQEATINHAAGAVTDFIGGIIPSVVGTIASVGDSFASSLIPGVNKDDFANFLQTNGGEFGKFYNDHRAGLTASGGVLGAMIPGAILAKAVRTGGFIGKFATKTLGEDAAAFVTSTEIGRASCRERV